MDDLDVDITRTLDDAVDEAELLPNRYQNVLVEVELPLQTHPQKPELLVEREKMTVLQLILLATHGLIGVLMYKMGHHDGQVEGRIEQFQANR